MTDNNTSSEHIYVTHKGVFSQKFKQFLENFGFNVAHTCKF